MGGEGNIMGDKKEDGETKLYNSFLLQQRREFILQCATQNYRNIQFFKISPTLVRYGWEKLSGFSWSLKSICCSVG